MSSFTKYRVSIVKQYLGACLLICLVATTCYCFSALIGYRVVGFVLLLSVSLLAMVFDILPVLFAATLSALVWNYFFIPPHFTLQVSTTEDMIMLLMYFLIAVVNAVLTFKIKQVEKAARDKEEKEHTVKLYNTLLNSLSHELRTPIASIIGATDNLLADNTKLSPQNRYDLITEISKATFRLNRQVENLLNMSRLESGFIQPKIDWCDVNELVYDVVRRIEEDKITQQISININPDIPFFKIDQGMLEQVLNNLLFNAIQYSPEHSVIHINAVCHADVLQIVIEDNGIGFPENEIKNVFDKFYRLKSSKLGGTGLGLSIVKGFTEAMNGKVSLENIPGGGARFIVEIAAATDYIKNLKNE